MAHKRNFAFIVFVCAKSKHPYLNPALKNLDECPIIFDRNLAKMNIIIFESIHLSNICFYFLRRKFLKSSTHTKNFLP